MIPPSYLKASTDRLCQNKQEVYFLHIYFCMLHILTRYAVKMLDNHKMPLCLTAIEVAVTVDP